MLLSNEWNDFYSGSPSQSYETCTSRVSPSSGSVYIRNSLFESLTPSSKGGAIFCNSISLLSLFEETSFVSCKPSAQGGALYLSITGESIISKICGYDCIAVNNDYQFYNIIINQDATKRNFLLDSSICHSIQASSNSRTLQQYYGNINVNADNISQNECYEFSALVSLFNAQSDGFGFMIKLSSLTNNTSRNYICLGMYQEESAPRLIDSCNVLNNKEENYGLINTCYGKLFLNNSCILGNTAKYQVSEENGRYGSVISNCTIDFTSSSISSGISIVSSPSTSFINKIACLSTNRCQAYYDSFGKLTVIPDQASHYTINYRKNMQTHNALLFILLLCS